MASVNKVAPVGLDHKVACQSEELPQLSGQLMTNESDLQVGSKNLRLSSLSAFRNRPVVRCRVPFLLERVNALCYSILQTRIV